jgi:hypothetical protein
LFGHVLFSLPQNKTKICKEDHKPYCYCWNQLQLENLKPAMGREIDSRNQVWH